MLGLFYSLINNFWLVFQIYLFLQNNLASLQTMLGKAKHLIESNHTTDPN